MNGRQIARILQRTAEREDAASPAVVVLRRPVILLAGAAAADRRQRDHIVGHQRIGLQAAAERGEVA
jgi:hypothetical protein